MHPQLIFDSFCPNVIEPRFFRSLKVGRMVIWNLDRIIKDDIFSNSVVQLLIHNIETGCYIEPELIPKSVDTVAIGDFDDEYFISILPIQVVHLIILTNKYLSNLPFHLHSINFGFYKCNERTKIPFGCKIIENVN
jgi:hypothetical protein